MKKTGIFLICFLMIAITACSSGATSTDNKLKDADALPVQETVSQTPTEAAKNFLESVRQRNYSMVREYLSERSLNNLQQTIARSDINLDQTLKRIIDQDAQEMLANNVIDFEFRNEKITNNQASLEVKATNAPEYARISLSKENNQWKINIDETAPSQ